MADTMEDVASSDLIVSIPKGTVIVQKVEEVGPCVSIKAAHAVASARPARPRFLPRRPARDLIGPRRRLTAPAQAFAGHAEDHWINVVTSRAGGAFAEVRRPPAPREPARRAARGRCERVRARARALEKSIRLRRRRPRPPLAALEGAPQERPLWRAVPARLDHL